MDNMKFLADIMIGKLAKWMKICGFDVIYAGNIKDIKKKEIENVCLNESRILLTRDTGYLKQNKIKYLFIKSNYIHEQLREVFNHFNLKAENLFQRCLICNMPIINIDKENIKDKVPPYVYQTQSFFSTCPSCNRIYWCGTHYQRMKDRLFELLGEVNEKKQKE